MINDLWYRNAVTYSLDLDTFMDANGDGDGDFEGLIRRLDYLDSPGVDVLWLAPFQPSPMKDNGYDISGLVRCRSKVRIERRLCEIGMGEDL